MDAELECLNSNVAALQAIAQSQVINTVNEASGAYDILLANGTKLKMYKELTASAPELGVKDGYWTVNDEYVADRLSIEDLPVFSVNESGYWVLNAGEQSVVLNKAVVSEHTKPFAAAVNLSETLFELTTKASVAMSAPVVAGFMFSIDANGTQDFVLGQERQFNVTKTGVSASTVVVPQGWSATLTDNKLTITAPRAPVTKSVIADSEKEVSVIAVSTQGYVTIAKVQLSLNENISATDPFAILSVAELKAASVKVDVSLQNTTTWYYLLKAKSEEAPSVAELKAANQGSGAQLTLATVALTDYVLYVLPTNAEKDGIITSIEFSTPDYETYYEAYQAGAEIKIGSKTYSKATNSKAVVISNQNAALWGAWFNDGTYDIVFINLDASAQIRGSYNKDVVIIGNIPGNRPSVVFEQTSSFNQCDLSVLNASISFSSTIDKAILRNTSKRIIFQDCYFDLTKALMEKCTHSGVAGDMEGLELLNNDICVNFASDYATPYIISAHVGNSNCGELIVKNNVIWSKEGKKEFHFVCSQFSGTNSFTNVVLENNTFYNVNNGPYSNGRAKALITQSSIESFTFNGNIAYDSAPVGKNDASRPHFCWMYSSGMTVNSIKEVTTCSILNPINIAEYCTFNTSSGSDFSTYQQILITWVPDSGYKEIESWINPFAREDVTNGIFVTKEAYSNRGAQR